MSWESNKKFLHSTTGKLSLSYLAIIMLMSVGFSVVFYNTSSHALGRQIPPPGAFPIGTSTNFFSSQGEATQFFQQRINEGRRELMGRLVLINVLVFVGGAALSYYLARRTLQPIEENIEAQNQFVSDASHELRTPLTALKTSNEVALRKSKVTSADAKEVFKKNVDQINRLQQLTDSLLNLARNENSTTNFKAVGLSIVTADALNAIVDRAVYKKITIEDSVPKLIVRGDKASLTQALVTILDNAVKFSPESSTIFITGERAANYALLNVKDQGIGIKAVHLPHIFDRFYRVDASRSKNVSDGFGIGLSIAQKIVEQHNGEIIAASTPGKGSIFTLKLPLSQL